MSALHNLSRANNYTLLEKILSTNYKQNLKLRDKSTVNYQGKGENVLSKAEESVEGQKSDENTEETSKSVYEVNSEKESFKLDPSFIDKRDSFNRTPLHLACYEGHLEIVKLLVKYGANVYSPAKNGMTCLHFAAQKGHLEVLKFLKKHGAKINSKTNSCMTPLHLALMNENVDCALYLIDKGNIIKMKQSAGAKQSYNKKGDLPLQLASEKALEKLKEAMGDKFDKFKNDINEKRVIHKETVKFYKKRK